MKKQNKKKRALVIAALVAVVMVISGTFAWQTYQDTRINRVASKELDKDAVKIVETWEPDPDWKPGTTSPKEVQVVNSGNTPVVVRVSFEEMLQHLAKYGTTVERATGYNPADAYVRFKPTTYANLTKDVPVNVDIASFSTLGYKDVTAKTKLTGGAALPANLKVYAKASAKNDGTGKIVVTKEYTLWHEYTDPNDTGGTKKLYQKVTAEELNINETPTDGQTQDDWTYTVTTPKYIVYDGGFAYEAIPWAKKKLIGNKGSYYGEQYDYEDAATGLTSASITAKFPATPVPTAVIPTSDGEEKPVFADAATGLGNKITIKYDAITASAAAPVDKWIFNEEDGYFYYLKKLNTGAVSQKLMTKLNFASDAGAGYNNMVYDLDVNMEAIIANPDAVKDSAGWNLEGAAAGSKTAAIRDCLITAIAQ